MIEKSAIRKEIIKTAVLMTSEYKEKASEIIQKNVIDSCEFINAKSVFIYIGTNNEVQTDLIISKAFEMKKTVAVPLCYKDGFMKAVVITDKTEFSINKFNIKEPLYFDKELKPDEIDFAIIPCVSCTLSGIRLGHGGGYYDRFFENAGTKKAALCFKKLISADLPKEKYDVMMDIVITE